MYRFISVLLAASFIAAAAKAETYSFYNITNNGNPDIGSQLRMVVTAVGSQVQFEFFNDVGTASSVTEIYFDDGTLLGIAQITNSAGVTFFQPDDDPPPMNPPDLPGGDSMTPVFNVTQNFYADIEGGTANGVNISGEYTRILFDLQGSQTFADTLAALASGALRVGLHVRAIGGGGGSDSYVNNAIVPVPAAVLLGAIGVGMIGWVKRRRLA